MRHSRRERLIFYVELVNLFGVICAGLGIAGATLLGSLLGLVVERLPERVYAVICSLAGGIMLYAAVLGLIAPAVESASGAAICVGVLLGAFFIHQMNGALGRFLPEWESSGPRQGNVLLVLAIVVHHFPEGMAAGVSFGTADMANTVAVCTGIALQNIPEAMMILPAMSLAGAGRRLTAAAAVCSGGVEILGLCLGYAGVQLAAGLMPLLLSFAGGTMLYVVLGSMKTDTTAGVYAMLTGFCGMLLL